MQIRNSSTRYGAVAQAFHWATAVLVVAAWILGQVGEDLGGDGPRAPGVVAHMLVGLSVLLFLVMRFGWRLIDAPPAGEVTRLGALADRAAVLVHYALLALLALAPLAGIAYQFSRGEPLFIYGLVEIPSPMTALTRADQRRVKEVHETLSNALLILAGLHAAAGLFHHWVLRDGVLRRMWPFTH